MDKVKQLKSEMYKGFRIDFYKDIEVSFGAFKNNHLTFSSEGFSTKEDAFDEAKERIDEFESDSFEFKELNGKAQLKAIKDYISGWQETHNEVMTEDEVRNVLLYSDGMYDINGNYIGD